MSNCPGRILMIRGKFFFRGSEKTQNIAKGIMDLWKCCYQAVVEFSADNYHQHFPQHQHKQQVNNINNFSVEITIEDFPAVFF